jgi:UDP-N-acetylmuramoyl-tripeptide--D-alanyl-D-alanine ligase
LGDITVLDDSYNAGPNSMRAALETLRDFPNARRRVAILGTMKELGEWSQDEHRKIGQFANSCADVLIGVGEEMRAALEEARLQTHHCADAAEAANRVLDWVQSGDVVLVKGSRSVGLEVVVETVVNALGQ